MTLLVYLTNKVREDAIEHSVAEELDRLARRLEKNGNTDTLTAFPPPYFVKKKLGSRQGRLIAQLEIIDDIQVLVFLRYLIRKDREYEEFQKKASDYGEKHLASLFTPNDIEEFVRQRVESGKAESFEPPNETEHKYLYAAFGQTIKWDELVINEGSKWTLEIQSEKYTNYYAFLHSACVWACESSTDIDAPHFVQSAERSTIGVWIAKRGRDLYLLFPSIAGADDSARLAALDEWRTIAALEPGETQKAIRRSYPSIILADEQLWIEIERDPLANMTLSPEEARVLDSARTGDARFPLFINGRAGSGKSTILQYLYSEILYLHITTPNRLPKPPLYLTASGELLRVAKSTVSRIVLKNASLAANGQISTKDLEEATETAFEEFQKFLLRMLPADMRRDKFQRAKRIDYSRFRAMWRQKFANEKKVSALGAELCWHVIRTYIKGISADDYIALDDYLQLPESERSVDESVFEFVYDKVFDSWYRELTESDEYWDDQDLARALLEGEYLHAEYPAVFCDEAQDFTRLEMSLLLALNLFSRRAIKPSDISWIPFAFAGDQFQTLNPTGFRWESMKASFVEKFIFQLDASRRKSKADLNYHQLEFNYRSTKPIVNFSNLVQAFRAKLLDHPELKPQKPWTGTSSEFPVFAFDSSDREFWRKHKEHGSFVLILPCNEGEEADYVRADPVLNAHIQIEDGVPANVLSAARAKGREYPSVVVYGFGEHARSTFPPNWQSQTLDSSIRLQVEYFINRLYVAVSRPKNILAIVDSAAGMDHLWSFARDASSEERLISSLKNGEAVWKPFVNGCVPGQADVIGRNSAAEILDNAKAFESQGMDSRDPFMMKQAAITYQQANQREKALICRAFAAEFEGVWHDAATAFFEAGHGATDGLRCLWMGGEKYWPELLSRGREYPQILQKLEYKAVAAATETQTVDSLLSLLFQAKSELLGDGSSGRLQEDAAWADVLVRAIERVDPKSFQSAPPGKGKQIAELVSLFRESGLRIAGEKTAALLYDAGMVDAALAIWSECADPKDERFIRARAEREAYPDSLHWLAKLGDQAGIASQIREKGFRLIKDAHSEIASSALLSESMLPETYELAAELHDPKIFNAIASRCVGEGRLAEAANAMHAALIAAVKRQNWLLVESALALREDVASGFKGDIVSAAKGSSEFRAQILKALVRGRPDLEESSPLQRELRRMVRGKLSGPADAGALGLTAAEAGQLLEIAGHHGETTGYYKACLDGGEKMDDSADYYVGRYFSSIQKQANWERTRGAHRQAEQLLQQLKNLQKKLKKPLPAPAAHLPVGAPVYPEFSAPRASVIATGPTDGVAAVHVSNDAAAQLPTTGDIEIFGFRIAYHRGARRINIENKADMSTASYVLGKGILNSDAPFELLSDARYRCAPWMLSLSVIGSEERDVRIDLEAHGVALAISL